MPSRNRILLQITLPALLIGLALIAACVLGVRSLSRLQVNQDHLLAHDVANLQAAQELERLLRQLRYRGFVYVMDPSDERKRLMDENHEEFEGTLKRARAAADQPEELELIDAILTGYHHYREEIDDRSRWPAPQATIADAVSWADMHPVRHLQKPCQELLSLYRESIRSTRRANEELTERTQWTLLLTIVGAAGGLVAGAGGAWGLSRSFARLRLQMQAAQRELDLGSVHVAATGDPRDLDTLMSGVLTRVREVVAQLQEQERDRLRAEQLAVIGQLAAGVAHEIRNPLTGVQMLVEAALRPNSAGLTSSELEMIRAEVQRVERTVQGLLDFARAPTTDRKPHDLRELIRHAAESVKLRAEQRQVRIEIDVLGVPVPVRSDRDQLLSLLTNVLINGIEATPAHGTVRIVMDQEAGETIRVRVTDTGPGITPAFFEHLFTPFATNKPTGTGLGLSVARRIAQDHGGTLTAANCPEGGACFTLTIPLEKPSTFQHRGESTTMRNDER
jgi:signal transduction histidine kinase